MPKKLLQLIILCQILACACSCKLIQPSFYSGPLKGYGLKRDTNSITDFLRITIEPDTISEDEPAPGAGIGIGDVIGPIVGIALDLVNNAITTRQAEYTANYSNSATLAIDSITYSKLALAASINGLNQQYSKDAGGFLIAIRRYLIFNNANNYQSTGFRDQDAAAEFFFKVQKFDVSGIQLRLKKINYLYSKARFKKKNDKKDFLSISLDLKLSNGTNPDTTSSSKKLSSDQKKNDSSGVKSKDALASSDQKKSEASGVTSKDNQGTKGTNDQSTSTKSPGSGESIVQIPIIRPNEKGNPLVIGRQNLLINQAYFSGLPKSSLPVLLTLSVTVSEVNLSHINPSAAANFLKNNSADVTSLIKALFPSSSSSASSKTK